MTAAAGKIPAVFLDRDSTLNVDHGYTHKVEDFAWMPGAPKALALFHRHGIACFIVTNQGGIGKGLYTESDMAAFNDHLCHEAKRAGGRITDIAFCASHPDAAAAQLRAPSPRRKPAPGMILELAEKWNVDLATSVMIGDRDSDVVAGQAAGCHAYLFDGTDLAALARDVVERHFANRESGDD
jgi:D-glycero-D-manno-heptose 1,7-bisphosphate phosphatase